MATEPIFRYGYRSEDVKDPTSRYVDFVVIQMTEAGDQVKEHRHPFGHWSLVLQGVALYKVSGRLHEVEQFARIWIPKDEPHQITAKVDGTAVCCLIPGEKV